MPTDTPDAPEQNQSDDAIDDSATTNVSTPETDGERVGEAGHGYVGRTMDDRLKANPRERGSGEAGAAPGTEAPGTEAPGTEADE